MLEEVLKKNSQKHLWEHLQHITGTDKERFEQQLKHINYEQFSKLTALISQGNTEVEGELEPPRILQQDQTTPETEALGVQAIQNGELALLLVAGGKGTRLGFDAPKGMYPISPVKHKTLFELFAQTIQANQKKYGVKIPLYVMTSLDNDAQTKEYFAAHKNFNLDVTFFAQQGLPCVDAKTGNILLESPGQIAMSPDGTGSVYTELERHGIRERLQKQGIKYISYFQVDNSLAHFIDPKFIGEHIRAQAQISTKVVKKLYPDEKVGLLAQREGKTCLVEYSVMSAEKQSRRTPEGELLYRAANIALHIINVDFLEQANIELPYYLAHKKVPYYDGKTTIIPEDKNAYKFERFVFDALPLATHSVVYEVSREDEFAPVKNAQGNDSPETSRELQTAKFKRWLEASGMDAEQVNRFKAVEIAPSYALDKEEFLKKGVPPTFTGTSLYLE